MENIKLREPLQNPMETQGFGEDFQIWRNGKYVWFYKDIYKLKGHGGIDYRASNGTPVYSANDGFIMYAGYDNINGNMVQVWNEEKGFKTLYGHNSELKVKYGDTVKAGDLIALSGGTGDGTGPHLHFGLNLTGAGGNSLNRTNGYNGAIDPAPYLKYDYKGNLKENNMILKKIKGQPHIYLVDDKFGTKVMLVDMETLQAIGGKIEDVEEVSEMAGYLDKGTLIWVNRIIN